MSGRRVKKERRDYREAVREQLRDWDPLKPLRGIIARHYRDRLKEFPDMEPMCKSCAFRDGETRLEALSVLNALSAVAKGEPFYCHRDMPVIDGEYMPQTWDQMNLCVGWTVAAMSQDPEFKPFQASIKEIWDSTPSMQRLVDSHNRERLKILQEAPRAT